jgi:uncharacterized protein (UPF0332 family)
MNPLWKKARSDAASAEVLMAAGYTNGAVNRAYYAMFNAAKVVLAAIDPKLARAKSHASIIRRFGKHVVEERGFDRSLGRMFSQSEVARLTADYEEESVDEATARRILDEAHRFLAAVEQLLARTPK